MTEGPSAAARVAVEWEWRIQAVLENNPMTLDLQTQGDARTEKHEDVCNGYLPTELAGEEERKMGCAECCDCWCHFIFTHSDGSERDDADALRGRDSQVELGEQSYPGDEEKRAGELKQKVC